MIGSYAPLLVALSIIVACAASYSALDLAGRTAAARGRSRRWWLLGGALAMGIGIWSMHFTGMLAFRLHAGHAGGMAGPHGAGGEAALPMTYDMPRMLLSVLVAVLASALALWVVSRERAVRLPAWLGAGLAMGAAICGMHYIGMASLRVPATLTHRPPLVLASVAVAVLASFAALGLAFRLRDERGGVPVAGRLAAAVVMGLAIAGMHYTAMAAAVFTPRPEGAFAVPSGAVLATDGLAGAVLVGTLVVLVLALLGAALDRWLTERLRAAAEHERLYRAARTAREEADAANALLRDQAAELEEQAAELEEQAAELEQQVETAQTLAAELEMANAALHARGEVLETALERERLILDSLPDLTHVFDHDWHFRYLNPRAAAAARAGGLDPARLIGRPVLDAYPFLRGSRFELESRRAVAEGRVVEYEERYLGDGRWYEMRVVPTMDGAVALARDVTDRRRAADAERAARAAAEAASRAKSDFLGTMSHELRTPLNAIGGYAELLALGLRGPVTGPQLEDLTRIQRAQRHLLGLVNDVLDFARLEAGSVELAADVVPLADVVAHAHALVAPQLEHKGLHYEAALDGAVAWADRERVEQIVLNLLSNALKFTPAGGTVRVHAGVEGAQACLHVRDTGPGIPASAHEAIFQPFVQLSTGLTRTSEGSGLGLAISRDLARAMGGDVTVESVPGDGATFTLRLPAVPATHAAAR
jgi:PAS domain S-box-containing protein